MHTHRSIGDTELCSNNIESYTCVETCGDIMTRSRVVRYSWLVLLLWALGFLAVYYHLGRTTPKQDTTHTKSPRPPPQNPKYGKWSQFQQVKPKHPHNIARDQQKNTKLDPSIIYVQSIGRLGNNMFQYASIYGIAKVAKRKAVIAPNNPISELFMRSSIAPHTRRLHGNMTQVNEVQTGVYSPHLLNKLPQEATLVCCYLQSWKYFHMYSHDIRRMFIFRPHNLREARAILQDATQNYIQAIDAIIQGDMPPRLGKSRGYFQRHRSSLTTNLTYIGVHIRLGDLLVQEHQDRGYAVATPGYFKRAIHYFQDRHQNVVFVVCSDDTNAEKSMLSQVDMYNVHIAPDLDSVSHLAALSLCNHTIMSTGTFSWWAAYLAGGEAVYYKDWPTPGSELEKHYNKEDYFLPHWVPIA